MKRKRIIFAARDSPAVFLQRRTVPLLMNKAGEQFELGQFLFRKGHPVFQQGGVMAEQLLWGLSPFSE